MSGSPSSIRPSSPGSERASRSATASMPASAARVAARMNCSSIGVLRRRRSAKNRWSTVSSTPSARSASAYWSGNERGTTASRRPSSRAMRTDWIGGSS